VNVSDISELRPGSHSLAFVRSGSTANDKEVRIALHFPLFQCEHCLYFPLYFHTTIQTLSIISSENVLNLQFINEEARDLFIDRLFLFVLFFLVHKAPASGEEEEEQHLDETGVAVDVI
jgi:hypothetical protein